MIGQAEGITYKKEQRPGNGSSREEAGVLCGWGLGLWSVPGLVESQDVSCS